MGILVARSIPGPVLCSALDSFLWCLVNCLTLLASVRPTRAGLCPTSGVGLPPDPTTVRATRFFIFSVEKNGY